MIKKRKVDPFWMCLALLHETFTLYVASCGLTREHVLKRGKEIVPDAELFAWNFTDDLATNRMRLRNWLLRRKLPEDEVDHMLRQLGKVLDQMFAQIGKDKGWR